MTNAGTMAPDPHAISLTIMIPAYREAENLRLILQEITKAAAALTDAYEVLVVDTEEDLDGTREICQQYGVRHVSRRGGNHYGDAIRTGIAEARGRFLLCMDADGSHHPKYFLPMWEQRERFDIVIGSRYAPGGQTENPAVLIWMSYVVNLTFRMAFSIRAKDVTNSFRLYQRSILQRMNLESNEFDILEEILIKAVTHCPPASITEVPVTFERRKAGESKRKLVQFAFGYLKTLQKLRSFQAAARQELKENGKSTSALAGERKV